MFLALAMAISFSLPSLAFSGAGKPTSSVSRATAVVVNSWGEAVIDEAGGLTGVVNFTSQT